MTDDAAGTRREGEEADRAGRRDPDRDGPAGRSADAAGGCTWRSSPILTPGATARRWTNWSTSARNSARLLGERCVAALGITPAQAQSYGKAAIVGEGGELEHAAAILHPKLGAPLRKAVEKGAALVPSAKKLGGIGTAIDVPLGHKDAAYVRSHFDAIEVRVPDAPQGRRDRGRDRGHGFRPAIAEDRRSSGTRGQGRGRAALAARKQT